MREILARVLRRRRTRHTVFASYSVTASGGHRGGSCPAAGRPDAVTTLTVAISSCAISHLQQFSTRCATPRGRSPLHAGSHANDEVAICAAASSASHFTLEQMRDLLDASDHHDVGASLDSAEREALLEGVRAYEQAATEQVEKLRVQLSRAEDFAATLRGRLPDTDGS